MSFLKEGLDYYYEGSNMIFTREYLLKRGECCRRGCRNCPYGFKKKLDK